MWNHFRVNVDKTLVKCNYCPLVVRYKNGTGNYWRHIENIHNIKFYKSEESK